MNPKTGRHYYIKAWQYVLTFHLNGNHAHDYLSAYKLIKYKLKPQDVNKSFVDHMIIQKYLREKKQSRFLYEEIMMNIMLKNK